MSYLAHVVSQGSTPNGVFGLKLHYYQLEDLSTHLSRIAEYRGLPIEEALAAAFPDLRYVWLKRNDKPRQAISYYRACQTGTWWVIEPDGPLSLEVRQPVFDPQAIARLEELLVANEARWQRFFERCRTNPLVVTYEELSDDYVGTIAKVLSWLGVARPGDLQLPPPRLRRQADHLTEAWLGQYAAFTAERAKKVDVSSEGTSTLLNGAVPGEPERVATPPDPQSPLFALTRIPAHTVSPAWRQWIAKALLQDVSHETIVETMGKHGFDPDLVTTELRASLEHPYFIAAREVNARLTHGTRILGALDQMCRLQSRARTVPKHSRPSRTEFCENYYSANRPVVLTDLMDEWPAMDRWTPDFLRTALRDEEVEIMAERNRDPIYETNAERHRRHICFRDFVDLVYSGAPTNDYYLVANNQFFRRSRAQVLLQDFTPFPEYLDPARLDGQCFFWFGPEGTVTPLHHDPCNILIAQVTGRKRFKLIPSAQWEYVYASANWVSDIDCEELDLVARPSFRQITVLDVTIAPGEVLFIPVGWSHHVRALEPSISISFTNFVFPNHFHW
jgi:LPS sulfotransferase NodH